MSSNSFTIGPYSFNHSIEKGKVINVDEKFETLISGSGGGGYIHNGQGRSSEIRITSSSLLHKDIYLYKSDGKQFHRKVTGYEIPCIKDNEMSFLTVEKANSNIKHILVIRNITLDKTVIIEVYLKKFISHKPSPKSIVVISLILLAVVLIILKFALYSLLSIALIIGTIILIVNGIWLKMKYDKEEKIYLSNFRQEIAKVIRHYDG